MNKWKIAFFVCIPITILSLLFSIYVLVDNGVSYAYLEVSYNDQLRANEVLGNLVVRGGREYTQKYFLHLLRQAYPEELIVEDGAAIQMGSNVFDFHNNTLIKAR